MDLTAEMEEYLRQLESRRFARPPREALAYAAGVEIFGPEMHLAFNTAPYVFIGEIIRGMPGPPARILELGCGTGYDVSYLKDRFARRSSIVGIDRVPALVSYAAEHYSRPGLSFLSADAGNLPFREESCRMVIAVFSIIHTMTRARARDCLAEILRVLQPGGSLIFTTLNRELWQDLYHDNPDDDPRLFFCSLIRHAYSRRELRSLLLPFVGEEGNRFSSFSIGGLVNTALRPAWEETLATMRRKRFSPSGREAFLPFLARRLLPPRVKARYFFGLIRKACQRRKISLSDIARGAQHHPQSEGVKADHFLVTAKKAG